MNHTIPTITRIDHDDPKSQAALDAEQRLFAHYGLQYKVHFVELPELSLRVRVLEVGEGRPLFMIPGGSGDAVFYAALAAEVAYHFFNLPTYLETWTTLISAVSTVAGAKPHYRMRADELQRVQLPVQFVWGDNDPFGNLEVARRVKLIMPNAELYEMRAGHLPFLDKPEECGRVIQDFLAK